MGTQRKSGRGGGAGAKLWSVPALVLGDTMARPVSDLKEVEQFFGGAEEQYNARGIADTRAEIAELRWPTPRIAIAEVRWPWLDAAGIERGDEVSTYVFRRDDAGKLKIQAVIMHGASSDM